MKIIIEYKEDSFEYRGTIDITFLNENGEIVDGFHVHDGEPEDNNLGRNFNDCYKLPGLFKKIHEAGKNGEKLTITESDIKEEE